MPCQFAVSSRRISIHALREEGDLRHQRPCILLQQISIHALREEGDAVTNVNRTHVKDFYPRPPRGGRRLWHSGTKAGRDFYPRPPRGGRRLWHSGTKAGRDFYPRPPRGGRLSVLYRPSGRWRISIHALREEGDATFAAAVQDLEKFLSTPSARRATGGPQRPRGNSRISIHALREEGDWSWSGRGTAQRDFYPRPPRGGRHRLLPSSFRSSCHFYPRPPRGGRHRHRCSNNYV